MNTRNAIALVAASIALGAGLAHAGAPTRAYIMEGSGFFNAPGVEIGRLAAIDLADPSQVTPLSRPADDLRFGGLDVRPGDGVLVAFENTTNSLRIPEPVSDTNTLIDSIGFMESGVAGLTFSNDGAVAYATTSVSGFGRIVRANGSTGAVLGVHNILNVSLSSLATVPEGHPTYPAGQIWGLGLTGGGSLRLYQLNLDNNTVLSQPLVSGIGFNPQFETGLDWAADGTLYALIQGFRETSPGNFEEISSHLYTINPANGQATLIGVVGAQGTWDAVSLALDDQPLSGCPADLAEPFGQLNFFDLAAYLALYNAQDPGADLAEPFGAWNFFDLAAYLTLYNAGCP
jgi:hypothetical protein